MEIKRFNEMIDYIEEHLTEDISLEDIANFAYFSLPHIHRIFKDLMDYTLKEYIRKRRLSEAAIDLIYKDMKVIDIAIKYQYNSNESFTRAFKQLFGVTPVEYRKNEKLFGIVPKHNIKKEGKDLKLLNEIEVIFEQFRHNPSTFNLKMKLSQYKEKVIEEVKSNNYNKDSVNFAVEVLFRIGQHEEMINIFNQYLTKELDVEDEAWARYNLFMLKRKATNDVKEDLVSLFEWIISNLPKEKWYWITSNASMMLDIFLIKDEDKLISIIDYIRKYSIDSPENRHIRFETSRSLTLAYYRNKQYEQCLQELDNLEKIVNEDHGDINYYFEKGEFFNRKMMVAYELKDLYLVDELINKMVHLIDDWRINFNDLCTKYKNKPKVKYYFRSYEEVNQNREPYKAFRCINHNFACILYHLKRYKLAITYFEISIDLKSQLNPYSCGLYLGSLWEVTKDKTVVANKILEQKRLLENNPNYWKRVPELKQLTEDNQFKKLIYQ
ncbi:helix-turn-helix transcriptional regulator [Mycoplasmatota bacterium]|nr:helix-turn-helix transcriptional regulator [Mycoplasmatota bacterium]